MDKTVFGGLLARRPLIIITIVFSSFLFSGLYYSFQHKLHDFGHLIYIGNRPITETRCINEITVNKSNISAYAVCRSQLSQPLVCPKLYEGRINVTASPDVVGWIPAVTNDWGNTLSPYWQARGVAFLWGSSFALDRWDTSSWIRFLPVWLPPVASNSCVKAYPELLLRMCKDPGPDCNMLYAHKCVGAWNYIRNQIQQETRAALELWAHLNNRKLPVFNRYEMVVFDHCERNTMIHHYEYGPVGFSALQCIPKIVKTVYRVYAKDRTNFYCDAIRTAHANYLRQTRPDISVIHFPGDIWEDFAKLVYAPYVLVMYAGSSFALWSTLANVGHVWIPPVYGGMTPDVG
ncbi:unnamed protein product, partial [Rotaria sp. Silwood1]